MCETAGNPTKISSPFGAQRAPEAPKMGQARTDGKRKTSAGSKHHQLSCSQNHSSTPLTPDRKEGNTSGGEPLWRPGPITLQGAAEQLLSALP